VQYNTDHCLPRRINSDNGHVGIARRAFTMSLTLARCPAVTSVTRKTHQNRTPSNRARVVARAEETSTSGASTRMKMRAIAGARARCIRDARRARDATLGRRGLGMRGGDLRASNAGAGGRMRGGARRAGAMGIASLPLIAFAISHPGVGVRGLYRQENRGARGRAIFANEATDG
jgi:hypothetical protein